MGSTVQPQTTAPAGGSLIQDALDVFNVLHDPTGVFSRVKERARMLAPWLVLSLCFIATTILVQPYQQAAMDAFKATLTPEQAARMGDRAAGGGVLGFVFTPLFVFVALAIGAGLLWVGVSLSGTPARFKTLFSVLAYSCITYVLFSIIVIVVLTVRGKAAVAGFEDLRAPLGLDLLTPNAGLYLGTVLNGINPFSAWGVWLTGNGISITHGTSRATGIVVTAVVYVLCLLIMAVPTLFLGMMTRQ